MSKHEPHEVCAKRDPALACPGAEMLSNRLRTLYTARIHIPNYGTEQGTRWV